MTIYNKISNCEIYLKYLQFNITEDGWWDVNDLRYLWRLMPCQWESPQYYRLIRKPGWTNWSRGWWFKLYLRWAQWDEMRFLWRPEMLCQWNSSQYYRLTRDKGWTNNKTLFYFQHEFGGMLTKWKRYTSTSVNISIIFQLHVSQHVSQRWIPVRQPRAKCGNVTGRQLRRKLIILFWKREKSQAVLCEL